MKNVAAERQDMASADGSPRAGAGVYFDGRTGARQPVTVRLGHDALSIEADDGRPLAAWPFDALVALSAPASVLRLGRRGSDALERLEISDAALADAIDARAGGIDRTGALRRRQRRMVIAWGVAAAASALAVAWAGLPAIATGLAPRLPASVDRVLGQAIDLRVRAMLDERRLGAGFACGTAADEKAGRAALDTIVRRLAVAAALPFALRVDVVRRREANAVALPGGHIYIFRGLIDKAGNGDEVAGVIAHEIGHVAHRDGTRSVLQAGGLSFLFGMLLGDFVGGGAVVVAARTLLQSSYSRAAESAADRYGATLMVKAHGDARALGVILGKIGGATEPGMPLLRGHPDTRSRIAAIDALAGSAPATPFLTPPEWTALRHVCAGSAS